MEQNYCASHSIVLFSFNFVAAADVAQKIAEPLYQIRQGLFMGFHFRLQALNFSLYLIFSLTKTFKYLPLLLKFGFLFIYQ